MRACEGALLGTVFKKRCHDMVGGHHSVIKVDPFAVVHFKSVIEYTVCDDVIQVILNGLADFIAPCFADVFEDAAASCLWIKAQPHVKDIRHLQTKPA